MRSIVLQHLPKRQTPAKFLMLSGLVSIVLLELYTGGRQFNLYKAFAMNALIAPLIERETHYCLRLVTGDRSILMGFQVHGARICSRKRKKMTIREKK